MIKASTCVLLSFTYAFSQLFKISNVLWKYLLHKCPCQVFFLDPKILPFLFSVCSSQISHVHVWPWRNPRTHRPIISLFPFFYRPGIFSSDIWKCLYLFWWSLSLTARATSDRWAWSLRAFKFFYEKKKKASFYKIGHILSHWEKGHSFRGEKGGREGKTLQAETGSRAAFGI